MGTFQKIKRKIAKFLMDEEKYARTIAVNIAREKGVKVGSDCRLFSSSFSSESFLIEIGNHVTITEGVKFVTHDGGMWVVRKIDKKYEKSNIIGEIKVGNNVFIGLNSIILPGVTIGDNTIVAAGSVVTKSFEGNCIIGGVPAKKIKSLDEYIRANEKNFIDTIGIDKTILKNRLNTDINKYNLRKRD